MMLISNLNIFGSQEKTQASTQINQINLKHFADIDLDTTGWYAIGHHDPEEFLAAVVKREPYANFSADQVQLTWAQFQGNDFEVTDIPLRDTQAITLVEDWGEVYMD